MQFLSLGQKFFLWAQFSAPLHKFFYYPVIQVAGLYENIPYSTYK